MHIFHPDLSHLFTSAAFRSKVYTLLTKMLQLDDHHYFYPIDYNKYSKNAFVMAVQHCSKLFIEDKPFLYYTVERQGMWVSKNVMHVQRKICRNIVAQYQIEHAIERTADILPHISVKVILFTYSFACECSVNYLNQVTRCLPRKIKGHPSHHGKSGSARHVTNATVSHLTDRSTAEKLKVIRQGSDCCSSNGILILPTSCNCNTFRCLAKMIPEGSTRVGILPGCPSLDRGSREAEVGFEPRTYRSINSRSNNMGHLAPKKDNKTQQRFSVLAAESY
ncbi:hypothetical protein T265_05364 [Opisthorchis viverrini]|uniref:Uncharacterized protein n=1 Tax=Opisthorchis viverrini TaxID=6198 RepID=A0A074ZKV0_OPIVI|nr:hypothetical protein T265_05364 [Opisthorchis viverrini]KER27646.1 hypothetical protein T265_05364 [Opisthorchis viverrini]